MSTIPNLHSLKMRMHELDLKKAKLGIATDPSILTESEDLEIVIGQMELIDNHRGRLSHLLQQRANMGIHTPAHIHTQIKHERDEIERLRAVCSDKKYPVQSHPLDRDEPIISTPSVQQPVEYQDPIENIREKLRDIEAMLRVGVIDHALKLVKELQEILK